MRVASGYAYQYRGWRTAWASNRTHTGGRRGVIKPEAKACGRSEESYWFCYSASSLASQIFNVLSLLPLTIRWPSGLNATLQTSSSCPLSMCSSLPVLASSHHTHLRQIGCRDCARVTLLASAMSSIIVAGGW